MDAYVTAGRAIALPREWGQQTVVWLQCRVDALWPQEQTLTAELERRAMCRENSDNLAELALHLNRSREALQQRRDTLASEIVSDQALLARLDRELEQLS